MSGNPRADVAVIGLGAMGAAILYQLAKRNIRAVGLDRHAPPHVFGSSHGETRITRRALGEGAIYAPLALASHRIWRELEAETGASLLEARGCLVLSQASGAARHHGKDDFVARAIAAARACGVAHEVLTGAEVARRFPALAAPPEARACFEPGGGFVYPERCISVQLDLARRNGARFARMRVDAIEQREGFVRVVAEGGVIEAERAIVAAGAWTGPLLGPPFDRLLTVRRQVLHWFPADGEKLGPDRMPATIWIHGEGPDDYFYCFPSLPGSGLLKAATEQEEIATTADTVDRAVAPREADDFHARHLKGRLAHVGAPAERSAVCLYTVTPDSDFIIDRHPRMDRVLVVSACSGHGFKHSAGIGEQVALSLAGEEAPALRPFSLARFAGTAPAGRSPAPARDNGSPLV